VHQLVERLKSISPELAEDLEVEELILYPKVKRKIERQGLKYYTAYTP
jgi:iron-sulfur cluster repair protein YtfE (RIC family)